MDSPSGRVKLPAPRHRKFGRESIPQRGAIYESFLSKGVDMERPAPIAEQNGFEILGPPGPPPGH